MKYLLTRKHMLFTEFQKSAAFRSYCILKLGNLVGFHIKSTKILKFRIFYAKGINCCPILLKFVSKHLNMQPNILNFWIFGDLKIKGIWIVYVSEVKSTIFLNWVQNFGHLWAMTKPLNWVVAMQIGLQ